MKPSTFNRRSIFLGLGLGAIVGCTKEEVKLGPEKIYELLSTTARGFPQHIDKVQLSQIFVMFDPQCPHCTKLWSETKAIKKNFYWIPVSVIRGSQPISAAILGARDSVAMFESIKAGKSIGTPAPDYMLKFIDENTKILGSADDATGVPFMVGKKSDNSVINLQGYRSATEIQKSFNF